MNDWELLGIIGAGVIIGLVAENNKGIFKRITQTQFTPAITPTFPVRAAPVPPSHIVPISAEAPRPATIDLSKGKCPPGMYLDQTLGIYRCRSAGRIRSLSPSVKMFEPQWQRAWGLDEDCYGYYYDEEGYATEPNMTQPLVQPDINKMIESQIKRQHQKEVKRQDKISHGKVCTGKCKKDTQENRTTIK